MSEHEGAKTVAAVRRLARRALALAVARYVADHGEAKPLARSWLDAGGRPLLKLSADELAEAADEALADLAAAEAQLRKDDELWETRRVDVIHARLTLQAARSGSFGSAVGMFHDFLREAGEKPQTLDIH